MGRTIRGAHGTGDPHAQNARHPGRTAWVTPGTQVYGTRMGRTARGSGCACRTDHLRCLYLLFPFPSYFVFPLNFLYTRVLLFPAVGIHRHCTLQPLPAITQLQEEGPAFPPVCRPMRAPGCVAGLRAGGGPPTSGAALSHLLLGYVWPYLSLYLKFSLKHLVKQADVHIPKAMLRKPRPALPRATLCACTPVPPESTPPWGGLPTDPHLRSLSLLPRWSPPRDNRSHLCSE